MRARTIDTQRKEEEEEASPFTKLQLGEEKSVAFDQQRERERGVRNDRGEVGRRERAAQR